MSAVDVAATRLPQRARRTTSVAPSSPMASGSVGSKMRSRRFHQLAGFIRRSDAGFNGDLESDPIETEVNDRVLCIEPLLRREVRASVGLPASSSSTAVVRRNVASHHFGTWGLCRLNDGQLRRLQRSSTAPSWTPSLRSSLPQCFHCLSRQAKAEYFSMHLDKERLAAAQADWPMIPIWRARFQV